MNLDTCIYCQANGCRDNTAEHAADCPTATGLYPVDADMVKRETVCASCEEPFRVGDTYAETVDMTHPAAAHAIELAEAMGCERVTFTVCLGCAALNRQVAP